MCRSAFQVTSNPTPYRGGPTNVQRERALPTAGVCALQLGATEPGMPPAAAVPRAASDEEASSYTRASLLAQDAKAEEPKPTSSATSAHLDQLNGMRTLATTWIVLGHYIVVDKELGFFAGFLNRGMIPLDYYFVLSGFVTHWTNGARDLSDKTTLLTFFRHRFGRAVFTYYFAFFLGLLRLGINRVRANSRCTILAFVLLDAWDAKCVEAWAHIPNGPAWTISALMFCWIAYPAISMLLRRFVGLPGEGRWPVLVALAAMAYAVAVLPPLLMLAIK